MELPAENQRQQIIEKIWRRLGSFSNCLGFSDYLLRQASEQIPLPKDRPSDPPKYRHEQKVILVPGFLEPAQFVGPYLETIKPLIKDKTLPLVENAEELFTDTNKTGMEIMGYCQEIENKMISEFEVKNADQYPVTEYEEHADYQNLTIFIVETQIGIHNGGLMVSAWNREDENGEPFALMIIANGSKKVWNGPGMMLESRRLFIDDLISDRSKIDRLITELKNIQTRAAVLNGEFGSLLTVEHQQLYGAGPQATPNPQQEKKEVQAYEEEANFGLPKLEKWADLKITVLDSEVVKLEAKGEEVKAHYTDLGFLDRKSFKPNMYWVLLTRLLAREYGKATADSIRLFFQEEEIAAKTEPRQIMYQLKARLKGAFKLNEDPFYDQEAMGGEYQAKFAIRKK